MKTLQVIRKLIEAVTPPRIVSIRYDKNEGTWAIVDGNLKTVELITAFPCYLTDVKFSSQQVTERAGCGSNSFDIGLATGKLTYERPRGLADAISENLAFKGSCFVRGNSTPLTEARFVRLMPNRFASVFV